MKYLKTHADVNIPIPIPTAITCSYEIRYLGDYKLHELKGTLYNDAPKTLDFSEMLSWVMSNYRVNGSDVLEWMQYATACNALLDRFQQDYAGSFVETATGDGYIPGIRLEDIRFKSERGEYVAKNGATVITPYGSVKVPVPGKSTIIYKDFIAWAAVVNSWVEQFAGVLLKYLDLVKNPRNIGIPDFNGAVPSVFFEHSPQIPVPFNRVKLVVSTNKKNDLNLVFRNVNDYTQKVGSKTINIPGKGTYEILMNLFGFPYIPDLVVQFQPSDYTNTVLKEWTILIP